MNSVRKLQDALERLSLGRPVPAVLRQGLRLSRQWVVSVLVYPVVIAAALWVFFVLWSPVSLACTAALQRLAELVLGKGVAGAFEEKALLRTLVRLRCIS